MRNPLGACIAGRKKTCGVGEVKFQRDHYKYIPPVCRVSFGSLIGGCFYISSACQPDGKYKGGGGYKKIPAGSRDNLPREIDMKCLLLREHLEHGRCTVNR